MGRWVGAGGFHPAVLLLASGWVAADGFHLSLLLFARLGFTWLELGFQSVAA